jgi:acid phosphatase (class A)
MIRLLPPPPAANTDRDATDRAVFEATRALKDKPRWIQAQADAVLSPALYSCAVGVKLDPANAPAVAALMRKMVVDASVAINAPKDHYGRPRPYLALSKGGDGPPICVDKSDGLARSPSYPSGHSAMSWAWGLVLAELAPDRGTEIMMRARSIGESRVVCGVHYVSDVEAGRTDGAALVAALHSSAAFRADVDKARAEMAALRAKPAGDLGDCAGPNEVAAHPPY